jgi:hypothetical protein
MPVTRPRIMEIFAGAYWDLSRSLKYLRIVSVIALGVVVAQFLVLATLPRIVTISPVGQLTCSLLIQLLFAFLLTPFMLAVHRFLLIGEVTKSYKFEPKNLRFKLMFACLAALVLAVVLMDFIVLLVQQPQPDATYGTERPSERRQFNLLALPALPALIAILIFTVRVIVLLPAVAADAPGANWQNAFADTKGHFWFILGALTIAALPLLFGIIVLLAILTLIKVKVIAGLLMLVVLIGGVLMTTILSAAVASRVYRAFGNRLNQPVAA